jgi:ATP-binding cassette subfamily F protein uup
MKEAAWASRSPAARSTKQKGRLKRLDVLKAQRSLSKKESFELNFSTGDRLPGTLIELRDVSHGYGEEDLIRGFDLVVHPGDRVGILGPNGAGKSTLLKILAGSLSPRQGEMMRSGRVKVAVLDQHRTGLPLDGTVFEAAGGGNDWVKVGEHDLHVASFLNRFLFGREYLEQRVASLSGGERARLLLARLLLEGANLLMLDEPTNDLDLQTLRVLEEALLGMDGACIVVTHDRALLDRVCNSVLAFEGDGHIQTYASRLQHVAALAKRKQAPPAPKAAATAPKPAQQSKKLSYKEQQDLKDLPQKIEVLEKAVEAMNAVLAEPSTYTERRAELPELTAKLADLESQIEGAYANWEALSERA